MCADSQPISSPACCCLQCGILLHACAYRSLFSVHCYSLIIWCILRRKFKSIAPCAMSYACYDIEVTIATTTDDLKMAIDHLIWILFMWRVLLRLLGDYILRKFARCRIRMSVWMTAKIKIKQKKMKNDFDRCVVSSVITECRRHQRFSLCCTGCGELYRRTAKIFSHCVIYFKF